MKLLRWLVPLVGVVAVVSLVLARPATQGRSEDWLVSNFNRRAIAVGEHDDDFTFLVGGHLYGAPLNKSAIHPSSSLLANLDLLNASTAHFFLGLGDVIRFMTPRHVEAFQRGFVDRLAMPFFNCVGNHDVSNRELYEKHYGAESYYSFVYGHVLFICLDSELDVGRISGAQLEFLRERLEQGASDGGVHTIMVASHKLLWATERDEFSIVFEHLNSRREYVQDGSFGRDVLPLVRTAAASKRVIWMSGDIGIELSLPLFHHREPDIDLTWIATGIGDTKDDALLIVRANRDHVQIKPRRLDGNPSPPLEAFDLAFWREHFKN